MAKKQPTISETVAFEALRRAHADKRVIFFTDPKQLSRPGSPVYSPIDVFAPSLVMMASSLTLLFAFGLLEWMVALLLVLLYQIYGAQYFVQWRLHERTVRAILIAPYNLNMLWRLGGIAIAIKAFPEKNCVAPKGDWKTFCADWLVDLSGPAEEEPAVEQA